MIRQIVARIVRNELTNKKKMKKNDQNVDYMVTED